MSKNEDDNVAFVKDPSSRLWSVWCIIIVKLTFKI